MTKDRRLGRGLAALLGTPLEEESIVDGQAKLVAKTADPSASPTLPAVGDENHQLSQKGSPQQTSRERAVTGKTNSLAQSSGGVTGAVPLNRSPSETQLSAALELNVDEIDSNPFQPRRQFNLEEIASLAESIREHQQLQPVLVRKVGDRYQLISGERRLRATIHAGLKKVRAEVREADDRLVAELAIVENLQRKDLDPIEKALSFRRYIDQHRCSQEDLAKRLKIDRSTIANLMRLLELPDPIQTMIQDGKVTVGHARALLPLGEEEQQLEFARQIQDDAWTVRETERRVSEQLAKEDGKSSPGGTGNKGGSNRRKPQLALLEQQLRLALGTTGEIRQNASGKGKILINFANSEEFDRIFGLICPQVVRKAS